DLVAPDIVGSKRPNKVSEKYLKEYVPSNSPGLCLQGGIPPSLIASATLFSCAPKVAKSRRVSNIMLNSQSNRSRNGIPTSNSNFPLCKRCSQRSKPIHYSPTTGWANIGLLFRHSTDKTGDALFQGFE